MSDEAKVVPHRAVGYQPCDERQIADLQAVVDDAKSGKVTAFVAVAIGPDFSNWLLTSGAMTRQDRMNLIGQLNGMVIELWETERRSW